ncbi:sensor histidine kinase KdpD [Clostridium sp.]|uniref:sensor histidine kinase n=1 Tax=Clostridium sp. TaxID=1506 RepID=UPI0026DC1BBC|nr:HAMP domain-containing sensor histidine kinase [Clostridium sp.]MDO5038265.1 HAMP domain-containing sensor histidine kinase [Clostridium sp.]
MGEEKYNFKNLSKEDMILIIDELEHKREMQEKFILNISHDLRSPLNVIMSANQMLENISGLIDKEKEYLKMLKRNSYKMLKLIENLIDITRLEKNYFNINKKNIEIVSFIESTIESIDRFAKQKDLTLVFDTNKEECIVAVDPQALDRICINLISNAIKFSDCGSDIFIYLVIDNNYINIKVSDNGIGIMDEEKSKIFNRFVQASSNKEQKGSGIGLDLVKSLVELHDGNIIVESKIGEGSTFTVTIPNIKIDNEEVKVSKNADKVQLLEIEFSDIYLK